MPSQHEPKPPAWWGEALPEPGRPPPELRERWVILWDGDCGFCRRSVMWTLRHVPAERVTAVPYQQATAWLPPAVLDASPRQAHLRAPDGRYWGGGAVGVPLLRLAGHPWFAALLARTPLRYPLLWGYRWVTRHRAALGR